MIFGQKPGWIQIPEAHACTKPWPIDTQPQHPPKKETQQPEECVAMELQCKNRHLGCRWAAWVKIWVCSISRDQFDVNNVDALRYLIESQNANTFNCHREKAYSR